MDIPKMAPPGPKEANPSDESSNDSFDSDLVGEECRDDRGYGADFFKQINFDEVSSDSDDSSSHSESDDAMSLEGEQ